MKREKGTIIQKGYLLFDIGGSKTRVAISSDCKKLQRLVVFQTKRRFQQEFRELVGKAEAVVQGYSLQGIVGGVAGVLDAAHQEVIVSPSLGALRNKRLALLLSEKFQTPTVLQNDAALSGLGEATVGARKRHRIVAYLTVSTGIGGVRIVDGAIDANAFGFEPGHQIVDPTSRFAGACGQRGCLEDAASGSALQRRHLKPAEAIHDSRTWRQEAEWLSCGLVNVAVLWSPHLIVLGGGVMNAVGLFSAVKKLFTARLKIFPRKPLLVRAKLGELSGLYGAMVLARRSFREKEPEVF